MRIMVIGGPSLLALLGATLGEDSSGTTPPAIEKVVDRVVAGLTEEGLISSDDITFGVGVHRVGGEVMTAKFRTRQHDTMQSLPEAVTTKIVAAVEERLEERDIRGVDFCFTVVVRNGEISHYDLHDHSADPLSEPAGNA